MDRLKHLINQGGLKRGQLCIVAMPIVRSSPPTNNKDPQLTLESTYHVKQDSPFSKQI